MANRAHKAAALGLIEYASQTPTQISKCQNGAPGAGSCSPQGTFCGTSGGAGVVTVSWE